MCSHDGVVRVTAFADAKRDTPARKRRLTLQGRATPSKRSSISACKPTGDEMPLLIEMIICLGVN
jgi:hypothetical protein